MKSTYLKLFAASLMALPFMSCNDYLDKEPMSEVTPDKGFASEQDLQMYANNLYTSVLPSHGNWSYGIYGDDNNTDNMVSL